MLTGALSIGGCLVAAMGIARGAHALRYLKYEVGSQVQRLATGDLTQDINPPGETGTQQLLRSLQLLQSALRQALGSIPGGAEGVAVAAAGIALGNTSLSRRRRSRARRQRCRQQHRRKPRQTQPPGRKAHR